MIPAVLIGVASLTLVVTVWAAVVLFQRLHAVAVAVARLQRDLLPELEALQEGAERAQARMAALQERAEALRPGRD